MSEYTPGPWRVVGEDGTAEKHPQYAIESPFGEVAIIVSENCDIDAQVAADARLIASAPELLAACERQVANIERWLETGVPADAAESKSIYDQMKAAIAKAEGSDAAA
jgi:hypothetical protein